MSAVLGVAGEVRLVLLAAALVLTLFALALRGRSWTLWLAGYATAIGTLLLAWRLR